jgi:hypothetical protein
MSQKKSQKLAKKRSAHFVPILPRIVHVPLLLSDGTILKQGDKVEHSKYGLGTIIRIARYEDQEPVLYVEFEKEARILAPSQVLKVSC